MSTAVIFDLDGTLADTARDMIAAVNISFERLGHAVRLDPVADAAIAMQGGGRAMLRAGLTRADRPWAEPEIDEIYDVFLKAYEENPVRHSRPYPGVGAMLDRLADAGFAMGICTNKPAGLADTVLRRLGLRGHFAALVGADTLPTRKPDPAPLLLAIERCGGLRHKSVLIGDSVTDRETARRAGVASILVTFGPIGAAVEALAPDALLRDCTQMPALLAGLMARAAPAGAELGG